MKEIDAAAAALLLNDPDLKWERTTGLLDKFNPSIGDSILGKSEISSEKHQCKSNPNIVIYAVEYGDNAKWFIRDW